MRLARERGAHDQGKSVGPTSKRQIREEKRRGGERERESHLRAGLSHCCDWCHLLLLCLSLSLLSSSPPIPPPPPPSLLLCCYYSLPPPPLSTAPSSLVFLFSPPFPPTAPPRSLSSSRSISSNPAESKICSKNGG